MGASDTNRVVVGISTRALFDLNTENQIFEENGLDAFFNYQREHESKAPAPGLALPLAKALLGLGDDAVELVLMSRNHPQVTLRVFKAIETYSLTVGRAALVGGAPLAPYLDAFDVDLFLSANRDDVQAAANKGIAAGLVYSVPDEPPREIDQIRIAFDGDCVLFSNEAQQIWDEQGAEAFYAHERANAMRALPDGPFAEFLRLLNRVQKTDPVKSPFRIALVTARQTKVHERALRTFDAWGVRIDEGFFLGRTPKEKVLRVFRPHIFFDDQELNCTRAASTVPTAQVLLPGLEIAPEAAEVFVSASVPTDDREPKDRFLLTCKVVLKTDFPDRKEELREWYQTNLVNMEPASREAFLSELEESVGSTPKGKGRRASAKSNSDPAKLLTFLGRLARKHGTTAN